MKNQKNGPVGVHVVGGPVILGKDHLPAPVFRSHLMLRRKGPRISPDKLWDDLPRHDAQSVQSPPTPHLSVPERRAE